MMNPISPGFRVGPVLAAICSLAAALHGYEAVQDFRQLTYPRLPDLRVPEVRRVTTDHGLRLFLLEDHAFPLIKISARIRVGSIYEPAEKIGLAAITGLVMRTGGTIAKTGDELDEELERIAAAVETDIGLDSGWASVSVLKEDIGTGLAILADVLMNPAFREDKVLLAKQQVCSAISRRNDSAERIASREFSRLIYGPSSVYARQAEYDTVDRITRDDLVAFHRRYFGPNNMLMAVWGDFETKDMVAEIRRQFEAWKEVESVRPEWPEVNYEYRSTLSLVRKANVNQSSISLGHIGGLMSDTDYPALMVMSHILGGGSTGRLFQNVRSRQGLAYSAGGGYGAHYRYPGVFSVGCQTKSESTVRAIRALIDEVRKIREQEVTDEELATAQEGYLNSFVFKFDSGSEMVNRAMDYEYYGCPDDFLQRMKQRVEHVTKADILRVAQARLQPDKLQILVVGRTEDFDEPLSVLGPVNEIDIAIPPPRQH